MRFPGAQKKAEEAAKKAAGITDEPPPEEVPPPAEAPHDNENAPPAGHPGAAPHGAPPTIDDPNAPVTMEAKVKSPPSGVKKVGRWTIDQLRQTDAIIPLQNGTNKFDSQKGMTKFGTPRNNTTVIKSTLLEEIPEEIARLSDLELRLQSGTNKYDSQKGMVGFGSARDVARESNKVNKAPADLQPLPEEKVLASEGVVRLQSGTNKFDSQKGMTGIGTNRRELTKMKDSKHPDYIIDQSLDQGEIPVQMGTNKFASQKKMTSFGTNRRELTKMKDSKHPEQSVEHPDQKTIPGQMGSNKYDSQRGMTAFGRGRWESVGIINPKLTHQDRHSQGMVPGQMGSNLYDSQKGMWSFGMPRDVKKTSEDVGQELSLEDIGKSETIIRSQAGWNLGDSQKGMTKFGTPRDVKGRHIKRLWELEFPEEAEAPKINA